MDLWQPIDFALDRRLKRLLALTLACTAVLRLSPLLLLITLATAQAVVRIATAELRS